MQHALTSLTDGSIAKIVMKDEEYDNGFVSWRQLYLRYGQTPKAKAHSRMSAILQWKFRENNFENDVNDWENEIVLCDRENQIPFPEQAKVGILFTNVTGSLLQHLLLNTDQTTPCKDVR